MRLEKLTKRTIKEMDRLEQRAWLTAAGSGLVVSVGTSLFGVLVSYYLTKSKSPKSDILASPTLALYVGGIVLFAVIIIAIAGFIRRQNRDVTRLTHRMAEIYLIALRNSALNPQPRSTPSHD